MESSNDNRTIAITSYGHGLCHMAELAFAAMIPAVMIEFNLRADEAVALGIPGLMLFGLAAPLAGFWADRRSYREALLGYYLMVAVAATFIIFFSNSRWMLMAGLTFLGIAISVYHPVGMAMLSHCTNRGRAMGINGVAGSMGIAIGPSFAIFVGVWRLTYALIAVCAVIGFVATVFVRTENVEPKVNNPRATNANQDAPPKLRTATMLLVMLFAAVAVGGFNYRTLVTALPSYLNGTTAAPVAGAVLTGSNKGALAVFIVLAMGGVGQMLGGHLADRFSAPKLYVGAILLSAPFAFFVSRIAAEHWSMVCSRTCDLHVRGTTFGKHHDRGDHSVKVAKHRLWLEVHSCIRCGFVRHVRIRSDLAHIRDQSRLCVLRCDGNRNGWTCSNICLVFSACTRGWNFLKIARGICERNGASHRSVMSHRSTGG